MRTRLASLLLAAAAMVLGACATKPQEPIVMTADYYKTTAGRIGVAVSEAPKADTSFPGAGCLLCIAAASAFNAKLTEAVRTTWTSDELLPLKGELVGLLKARSQQALAIDEPLNFDALPDRKGGEPNQARKDFSAVASKAGVDRLLVVNLQALGAWRNYSSYIPNGAPRAVFKAEAFIVNVKDHKLDWYQSFDLAQFAEGEWDEAPKFPGLTNAHFQVIEQGKDSIKRALQP